MAKGSTRPSLKYNSITQRWEVRGKGADLKASFGDDSVTKLTQLEVGATGDKVSKVYGFVATLVGNTAVASGFAPAFGTLQSVTGSGIGCSEVKQGDMIFGVPKAALTSVEIAGFHVPTAGCLGVYLTTRDQSAGSLAAGAGFDVVAMRFA